MEPPVEPAAVSSLNFEGWNNNNSSSALVENQLPITSTSVSQASSVVLALLILSF